MNHSKEVVERAIALRIKERKSVDEIRKILKVPFSTVRSWVKGFPLTKQEKQKRYTDTNTKRKSNQREYYEKQRQEIRQLAYKTYRKFKTDPFFMLGLGIYLGEGNKVSGSGMANMDIKILRIFKKWFEKYITADCTWRAYLHVTLYKKEYEQDIKNYWERELPGITWGKSWISPSSIVEDTKEYKGVLSLCPVQRDRKCRYWKLLILEWLSFVK